jgi:hypothetical protein
MKRLVLVASALLMSLAVMADVPNFRDARWLSVPLPVFGRTGLKVDKLTGDAWYQEQVNKAARWVHIPGPLSTAGRRAMSFGDNFEVRSTDVNVYLIGLRGGDSWRLADANGRPYWRKIQ